MTDYYYPGWWSQRFPDPAVAVSVVVPSNSAVSHSDPGGSPHSFGHDSRDTQELDPGGPEERQTLLCP